MNENATLLDSCEHLYLRTLEEPEGNALRLVLEEISVGDLVEPETSGGESSPETGGAQRRVVERGEGLRVFEVNWRSYIAYSVRNESYARPDPKGNGKGRVFIKHTRSTYLDYLSSATFASDIFPPIFPRPIMHWGVHCLNHAIDVASIYEPDISVNIRA